MLKARQEFFYNVVGCAMNTNICQELDGNVEDAEVEKLLLHILNGKSSSWDGITNEILNNYACILKSPFTQIFQQC